MVQAGLKVKADKQNVVASRLEGRWTVHAALTKRLTEGRPDRESFATLFHFTSDPTVAEKIPAEYDSFLKDERIYLAGKMNVRWGSARTGEYPFILIQHRGNPYIVYFRQKGDKPMGDAESFNVMLAVARKKAKDLLFIGGDFNNQPFSAFERVAEKKD